MYRYNKKRSDFKEQDEYNSYLEDIEDKSMVFILNCTVYSLIEKKNVDDIQKEIKEYERANKQQISIANLKKDEQLRTLELIIKSENAKLQPYYTDDTLDVATRERVNTMLKTFTLDHIDQLGENAAMTSDTVMNGDGNGGWRDNGTLQSSFEPMIYTLYRTEQPRCLENQYRQQVTSKEQEIRASGGPVKNSNQIQDPKLVRMTNINRQRAAKIFEAGLKFK